MGESLKVNFPHKTQLEFELGKPVVILGANGAGKTRFTVYLEKLNDYSFEDYYNKKYVNKNLKIHRLSAQKSLSINDKISLRDYNSAYSMRTYGHNTPANKLSYRYKSKPEINLLDDYNDVLSLLFAKKSLEIEKEHNEIRRLQESNQAIPKLHPTVVDSVKKIWEELLPQRKLDLTGNNIQAIYNDKPYHGQEMSDGERVILYMICQTLLLEPETLFIIDEPELHIHKAILNKLWTRLEQERQDCVFMYVTHDLNFAVSRNNPKVIWMKSYSGNDIWDYEVLKDIEYDKLPEELLYEIIGTRQKILFVEGTHESLDYKIYSEIYGSEYHIIPCESCVNVIKYVESKKSYQMLSDIKVYGIIDRDYRNDTELSSFESKGIYHLKVAEIENLFVVPELLELYKEEFGLDDEKLNHAKNKIIEIYKANINKQIKNALIYDLKYKLSSIDITRNGGDINDISKQISEDFALERINALKEIKKNIFKEDLNINEILKIFNFKEIINAVGSTFGDKKTYIDRIFNKMRSSEGFKNKVIEIMKKYVPELPKD